MAGKLYDFEQRGKKTIKGEWLRIIYPHLLI